MGPFADPPGGYRWIAAEPTGREGRRDPDGGPEAKVNPHVSPHAPAGGAPRAGAMGAKPLRASAVPPRDRTVNRVPAVSRDNVFELVALTVLGPIAWLVPRRFWVGVSHLISLAIARARPAVTRRRIERLDQMIGKRAIGLLGWSEATPDASEGDEAAGTGRADRGHLDALRIGIMSTYMEERLQILREYRPGGWRPRLAIRGREHIDAALGAGCGAVLLVSPFSYADLVSKKALSQAGYRVHHLSAFSRGFSPNSCHEWQPTRFGMQVLSSLRTRVEDRYLEERIIMPPGGGLGFARALERRLRDNALVSLRVGGIGHRTLALPMLGGHIRLATGAPSLALAHGAALLPVFVVRRDVDAFDLVVEPSLEPDRSLERHAAVEDLLRRYCRLLETRVLRHPYLWSGWYRLQTAAA